MKRLLLIVTFMVTLAATVASQSVIEKCDTPVDFVFVLDSSRSIGPQNFTNVQGFTSDFVKSFEVGPNSARFAALTFSDDVKLVFNLKTYATEYDITQALEAAQYIAGGTNTDKAFDFIRQKELFNVDNGGRLNAKKIVIVITDGESNDMAKTVKSAKLLKDTGATIMSVGILGATVSPQELLSISSSPDLVFKVTNFYELADLKRYVSKGACDASDPVPKPVIKPCNALVDIVLVLDSSRSIGLLNFKKDLSFCSEIVKSFEVGSNSARFAALIFSDDVKLLFNFKTYPYQNAITQALQSTSYLLGGTNTEKAFDYIRQKKLFSVENGGRPNAKKIVIVVTDGESNDMTKTVKSAKLLKDTGVTIMSVGILEATVSPQELLSMSSSPDLVFKVTNFNELADLKHYVSKGACDASQPVSKPVIPPEETYNALVDFVFVLESSTSVGLLNLKRELSFTGDIVKSFEVGPNSARFAALTFSDNVNLVFNLKAYSTQYDITQALEAAQYIAGGTNTDKAFNFILQKQLFSVENGGRPNAKKIVILVTDGESSDIAKTVSIANQLKATGVTIISIGILEASVSPQEILSISSSPDLVFKVTNFYELANLRRYVSKRVFDASLPGSSGSAICVAKARATTTTPKPCPALVDIVFVIDSSGSLGLDNYKKEQQFAVDIAKRFPIGPSGARFGCVIFSDQAKSVFKLSNNYDQAALEMALQNLDYLGYTTHTFKAFDLVYNEAWFSTNLKGRNNAAKIIIFLTDGNSSDTTATANAAQKLKDQGVSIISVGIGPYSLSELKAVASGDKNVFTASDFQAIDRITHEVAARACQVPFERKP